MHVHIHLFGVAIQEQQRERIAGRRHQVVIRSRDRVQQQAVANQTAVHKQVNRIAIELLHLRAAHESPQPEAPGQRMFPRRSILLKGHVQVPVAITEVEKIVQNAAAEDLEDALAQRRDGRNTQQFSIIVPKHEGLAGMRQAVVCNQRRDVHDFGLLRPQEFLARRNIEEQVANRDDGPGGQRRFVATQEFPSGDLD